jgi:hypothetical protein
MRKKGRRLENIKLERSKIIKQEKTRGEGGLHGM